MDAGITLLLIAAFGLMMFLVQRSEKRRRLIVFLTSLIVVELLRRYVWFRDVHSEAWTAFIVALLLNLFFWLFIGRYNPPGSSDDIQVIGMDD
ncbi:MAG: hypothetical protein KME04_01155 [Pleurocapsa minor GSE-CHR-MK-17-07R]|jgi:hypothetical protein|nr:hypothetical protein [Pleurocapsa minor GSE-CHR-MK 17-07R]